MASARLAATFFPKLAIIEVTSSVLWRQAVAFYVYSARHGLCVWVALSRLVHLLLYLAATDAPRQHVQGAVVVAEPCGWVVVEVTHIRQI